MNGFDFVTSISYQNSKISRQDVETTSKATQAACITKLNSITETALISIKSNSTSECSEVIDQSNLDYQARGYARILLTEMLEYTGLNVTSSLQAELSSRFEFKVSIDTTGKIARIGNIDAMQKSYILCKQSRNSSDIKFAVRCNFVRTDQSIRYIHMSARKGKLPAFFQKTLDVCNEVFKHSSHQLNIIVRNLDSLEANIQTVSHMIAECADTLPTLTTISVERQNVVSK